MHVLFSLLPGALATRVLPASALARDAGSWRAHFPAPCTRPVPPSLDAVRTGDRVETGPPGHACPIQRFS